MYCAQSTIDFAALLEQEGDVGVVHVLGEPLVYVPIDVEGARLLFQVMSACYERRSMIVTTNIEFSKWGVVLGDDKLASALIDRKCEASHLIASRTTPSESRWGT